MRSASLALIGLTVGLIVLALWTIGGPEQARAERRDQERMNDLHSLAQHLICLNRQGLEPGDRSEACPDAARRPNDPLADDPYRVEAVSEEFVRVCANFETGLTGHWWGNSNDFDLETGCLTVRERDPSHW
jgi:hypothetical protein